MGTKKLAANVECNGKISVDGIGQAATFEYGLGNFPNWEMVLPDAAIPATITLDFQLLNRLAQALGANSDQTGITLYVKDANSGVRVTCAANPEAVGVIMPRRP
jgi:hypothetical protein